MRQSTWPTPSPSSAPPFIGSQPLGTAVAVGVVLAGYPDAGQRAGDVVIPSPASSPDD
jgi:hypothetical protein